MVKLKKPAPFFYEGDERAILLLHSFTSTNRDMKKLANYLHEQGYTCYGPIYKGHGESPNQFLQYDLADWWQDAVDALNELYARGYETIHVIGVSLGGLFTLRLAQLYCVTSVVTMSVPNHSAMNHLPKRLNQYVENYLKIIGTTDEQIEYEKHTHEQRGKEMIEHLLEFIDLVQQRAHDVHVPSRLLYGTADLPLYKESANELLLHVRNDDKVAKGFVAGHLMTESDEKERLFAYIANFLNEQ
ncbi:alpha/beta hydrolase [Kurthia senegalensis]|uniref:alpha/beta hydrolase n=1 Tax=Kurthia senegalensis TaxID=1033740 RepID=UPI00028878F6|nr:alpha/beta fold hydrolase [Kurthia senegalensis]